MAISGGASSGQKQHDTREPVAAATLDDGLSDDNGHHHEGQDEELGRGEEGEDVDTAATQIAQKAGAKL